MTFGAGESFLWSDRAEGTDCTVWYAITATVLLRFVAMDVRARHQSDQLHYFSFPSQSQCQSQCQIHLKDVHVPALTVWRPHTRWPMRMMMRMMMMMMMMTGCRGSGGRGKPSVRLCILHPDHQDHQSTTTARGTEIPLTSYFTLPDLTLGTSSR